jgi:chromosome partitioning protein
MSDDLSSVVAQPYIVMRNDHQDALGLGLAVIEYAPSGKSADEVRGLWQWVEARLNGEVSADEPLTISTLPASPDIVPTMFVPAPAEAAALTS